MTNTAHKWRKGPRWTTEEVVTYYRACGFAPACDGLLINAGRFVCIACGTPTDQSHTQLYGRRAHKSRNACASDACIFATHAKRYENILDLAGFTMCEPYTRSTSPTLCRCRKCKEEVRVNPSRVRAGTYECPGCTGRRGGYDARRTGYVYFVAHDELRAWQVGVTNHPERRVREHERHGWRLVNLLTFDDGAEALRFERWSIRGWRDAGFPEAVHPDAMPQNGWTETVAMVNVPRLDPAEMLSEFRGDR